MTERTVLIRLKGTASDLNRALASTATGFAGLRKEINTANDRTTWLAQGILAIAPAAVTMGAGVIPVVAGLATQLTVAAGAAGVAGLAFNGIGDALKALNDYQLDPTTEKLEKMQQAMEKIGPDGERFVRFLDEIGPAYADLANAARGPLFAGVEDGLRTLTDDLLPRLKVITVEIAEGLGTLAGEAGEGLSGEGFRDFFEYLENNAKPLLLDMGRTFGNFIEGIANLMVEFGPLTDSFSSGMLEMSRSFAEWSRGLEDNDSFQAFLEYVQDAGPLVMDFFAAMVGALTALAKAAAPVGDLMLPAFTAFLRVVEALADTPLGPMWLAAAAAASIYGRAVALADITTGGAFGKITQRTRDNTKAAMQAKVVWRDLGNTMLNAALSQKQLDQRATWGPLGEKSAARAKEARSNMAAYGRAVGGTAAQIAGLGLVMSGLDEKLGLTNTAMLALIGSIGGPWGAAAGAAVGLTMDIAAANDELAASIDRADSAIAKGNLSEMLEEQKNIKKEMEGLGDIKWWDWVGHLIHDDELEKGAEKLKENAAAIEEARVSLAKDIIVGHGQNRGQGQMFRDIASDAKAAEVQLENLTSAFIALRNLLDDRASLINYERAMDDLRKSIKEHGQAWRAGGEAGRQNLEKLSVAADNAAKRVEELAGEGRHLQAQAFLTRSLNELRVLRDQAGPAGRQAIQEIINKLKEADSTNANPKVTVDTGDSIPKIDAVNRGLNSIDPFVQSVIRIRTEHMEVRLNRAGGGMVYGMGGPTDDKVPIMASNGEFIQKAAAVQKYGIKMMEDINALRFANGGLVQRFANGGSVQPSRSGDDPTNTPKFFLEEFKAIMSEFNATLDIGSKELQRELHQLAISVRKNGGEWTSSAREQSRELQHLSKWYHAQQARVQRTTEALDTLNSTLEDLESQQQALIESVSGQFNTQLTGLGGLGASTRALASDITGIQAMDAALAKLVAMGLDPKSGLYQMLVNSNDVKLATQLSMDPASLAGFQSMFEQRDQLNTSRGLAAGESMFGDEIRGVSAEIVKTNERLDAQTAKLGEIQQSFRSEMQTLRAVLRDQVPEKIGDEVGAAVNGAVSAGHQQGQNSGPLRNWGRW